MENRRSEPSVGGGANREDAGMTTSAQSSLCNVRLAVLLVVFLTASSLSAQVVTVTIQGRVYDTTGAAISQANVSVRTRRRDSPVLPPHRPLASIIFPGCR